MRAVAHPTRRNFPYPNIHCISLLSGIPKNSIFYLLYLGRFFCSTVSLLLFSTIWKKKNIPIYLSTAEIVCWVTANKYLLRWSHWTTNLFYKYSNYMFNNNYIILNSSIMKVSFIGGGNNSTRTKSWTICYSPEKKISASHKVVLNKGNNKITEHRAIF